MHSTLWDANHNRRAPKIISCIRVVNYLLMLLFLLLVQETSKTG